MRRLGIVMLLFLWAAIAQAESVVLGLSDDQVAITTSFDGKDILIFGAVRREAPINHEYPLEIVMTVAGPSEPIEVRRKSNVFGIWINTDRVEVDLAPSFYAVATSAPFTEAMNYTEDLRHRVSIDSAIRSVGAPESIEDSNSFTEALIRIRRDQGVYQENEGAIAFDQQTLFRTSLELPANLTEGSYPTRIFLTRDGEVVSHFQTVIEVRKVGLERFLFNLSRQQAAVYGIMSILIAAIAGWAASAGFRALRGS